MKKLVFILSLFMFFACGSSNTPEKVVEKFVRASLEGTISENTNLVANYDDASPLSDKASKELVSFVEGMRAYLMKKKNAEELHVDHIEILTVKYNNDNSKAQIEYITTINGIKDDESSKQYLIKATDGWKIVTMFRGTSWLGD